MGWSSARSLKSSSLFISRQTCFPWCVDRRLRIVGGWQTLAIRLIPPGYGKVKIDSNSEGEGDARGAAHWTRTSPPHLNYQASLFQSQPTPRTEKPQYKANGLYVEGTLALTSSQLSPI